MGLEFLRHGLRLKNMHFLLINAPDPWPIPFGAPGWSWYDLDPNQAPGIRRSLILLTHLTEELESQGFPRSNIILCGFSQGCVMSLELALRSPSPFFGVVGMSGFFFEPDRLLKECSPEVRRTPILLTHGYGDEVLPFETTNKQVEEVEGDLPALEFHALPKSHTIINSEFELIRDWYFKICRRRIKTLGDLD